MDKREPTPVPSQWLWLVQIASWIVPASKRRAWREQRKTEIRQWWSFLAERGYAPPTGLQAFRGFCWDSFGSAFEERFAERDPRRVLERVVRGPGFAILALAAALGGIAAGSGLLAGIRTVYAPLPYPEASRLVACFQVHFLSVSLGAQSRYFRPWRQRSQTLEDLAAYRLRDYSLSAPGRPSVLLAGAEVTPGFFPMLGVAPAAGRLFDTRDAPESESPSVVVSHAFWKTYLRAVTDPQTQTILLDGNPYRVLGVLPAHFWFRSKNLEVWSLMPEPGPRTAAPQLLGMVGKLRRGATAGQAKSELEQIAYYTPGIRGGPVRVVPLADYFRPATDSIWAMTIAGWLLALAAAGIQFGREAWQGKRAGREAVRYWGFFFVKVSLLVASLGALIADIAARNALSLRSGKFLVNLLLGWAVVLGILLIFRWAVLDQGRRCPVCLRRLAVPATSGIWSSLLIEPARTELLCDQGHGALTVSESGGAMGEIRRWVALEDDWRSLAEAGRQ